ncbi:MAG: ABC transporter substrate-binding protein [Candidatus Poribacteria bacterium]|nr:ABC transporter substrate-binding protein [Candidatus Poribacteria bacterium]
MTRITQFTYVLAIVALIMGISACDQLVGLLTERELSLTVPALPQLTGISGEVSIGLLYPMTGRLSETGAQMKEGFDLALKEINRSQQGDVSIKFVTADDKSTVDGAVEGYNRLIHETGVPVIIGPTSSSQCEAAFPIAQENRTVAFSATSAATGLSAIGDFIFRAILTSDAHIPNSVSVTHEKLGYMRAALIYDELHAIAVSGANAFRMALTENSVMIVTTKTFQTGETDFSDELTRIKASNPEVIFIAALPQDMPAIMIQARDRGIPFSVPFIVPELSIDDVQAAGPAAEGLISSKSWLSTDANRLNRAFVVNYKAEYGVEPNTWAAHSYTTVYILAQAIADAQSTDAEAIRNAMANIENLDTIFGNFSFDADGDAVHDATILTVENGEFKVFD